VVRAEGGSRASQRARNRTRVDSRDVKERFCRLQARLRDPLLTVLTLLLAFMLFVIAPLHAAGIMLA
jgi:hypothetical protein